MKVWTIDRRTYKPKLSLSLRLLVRWLAFRSGNREATIQHVAKLLRKQCGKLAPTVGDLRGIWK